MKANEIQIGDWVQDITPVVIDVISNEDICTYRTEHGYITANPSNLKPIPLTVEILEKNGWRNVVFDEETPVMQIETRCDAFWWDSIKGECGCERSVCDNGEECIEKTFFCKGIFYVHELQRALRCCGLFDKANDIVV